MTTTCSCYTTPPPTTPLQQRPKYSSVPSTKAAKLALSTAVGNQALRVLPSMVSVPSWRGLSRPQTSLANLPYTSVTFEYAPSPGRTATLQHHTTSPTFPSTLQSCFYFHHLSSRPSILPTISVQDPRSIFCLWPFLLLCFLLLP